MSFPFGNMDDMFGQMDRMMNQFMGGMFNDPFALTPFGMNRGMTPFNGFPNMMMPPMNMGQPQGSFYSSVVSYSSDGTNPPQVYEETNMNLVGPNGVREEKHTVRDSRSGVQKMKIGRHIQDRGHVIERSKNQYTGDQEENNEFINIEEEEAPQFNQEWGARMSNAYGSSRHQYLQGPSRSNRLAITAPESAPSSPAVSSSSMKKFKSKLQKKDKNIKKSHKKD